MWSTLWSDGGRDDGERDDGDRAAVGNTGDLWRRSEHYDAWLCKSPPIRTITIEQQPIS